MKILAKKYSVASILEQSRTMFRRSNTMLGFIIRVQKLDTPSLYNIPAGGEQVNRVHDVEMYPIYLTANYSNLVPAIGRISQNINVRLNNPGPGLRHEGFVLINDDTQFEMQPIPAARQTTGTFDTSGLEFYKERKGKFHFSFIYWSEIEAILELSDYIYLSGSQINFGDPVTSRQVFAPSFTIKLEGDLNNNLGIRIDGNFPQMVISIPCPPYWRPIGRIINILRNNNNFSIKRSQYQQLYEIFENQLDEYFRKIITKK